VTIPTAGLPTRHFNAYHQSNSLLFQFILSEFLIAYREIQALDSLCKREHPMALNATVLRKEQEIFHTMETILAKLVGSTREYMRLFSWNFIDGVVSKLKNYCALFSQNADTDEKEPLAMQHYADKAWLYCLQGMDALRDTPNAHPALCHSLEKGLGAMHRLARLIARVIPQFRDDENVVFFVLRHKDKFDKVYGTKFVTKLFCRMYPKGLKEVQYFLSQKYAGRGFENLMPIIHKKISELETANL
jgi:hypothetical protein